MTQCREQAREAISIAFLVLKKHSEFLILPEHTESVFLGHGPLLLILEDVFSYVGRLKRPIPQMIEMMKADKTSSIDLQEWLPKFETLQGGKKSNNLTF
jgi:hypothetical protein